MVYPPESRFRGDDYLIFKNSSENASITLKITPGVITNREEFAILLVKETRGNNFLFSL
jgi:hypothetical protein